jgi:hypothetical protein
MPNLITNIGMDRIGAGAAVGGFCRIGTGNTAPSFTDTALVSQSASTASTVASSLANAGASDYETEQTVTYEFALGAVVGNMAEVGVGWSASTASTLFSRALIVDGGGSPTTITVLITEILQVVYRLTFYPILSDETGSVVIGADTFNYTARATSVATPLQISPVVALLTTISQARAYDGNVGAVTAGPSGSSSALTAGSFATYTPGNFYRDFTISAALGVGNLSGGIRSILITLNGTNGTTFQTQIQFDNASGGGKILKDNTKVFSLTLRQYWSRH